MAFTQIKMKLFILVMLQRIFLTSRAGIPLCVPNTRPEVTSDLHMRCSAADANQCAPCSQDGCMHERYSIQYDEKDDWRVTYLSITSSTKDTK